MINVDCKPGLLSKIMQIWRYKTAKRWIRGLTVLDVGCGYGPPGNILSRSVRYIGIDENKYAIAKALENRKPNMEFYVLQAGKDALPVKQVTTVILVAVVEHLNEPIRVLKEITTYLSEGGRVIITTPTEKARTILSVGCRFQLFDKDAIKDHKRYYSKKDIFTLIQAIGLEVEHYHRFQLGLNQILVAKKVT